MPIGFGVLVGNIPFFKGFGLGIYEPNSVLHYLYFGVTSGVYPSIVFLGLGAMTDFSSLLARCPRLMLLGAAAQMGIYFTLLGALAFGFLPKEAASIAIIGGADGPTSIFLTAKLAPHLIGPIAIAAYSYMALIPIIQPPIMHLLTTKKERRIHMPDMREVSRTEKLLFPVAGLILCCFLAPASIPLLGPFFFGNLMKESGVVDRLAQTARYGHHRYSHHFSGIYRGRQHPGRCLSDTQISRYLCVGSRRFQHCDRIRRDLRQNNESVYASKINPLLGAAGVSAVPGSAREVHLIGLKADPTNYLLMHAMACNSSGVIGSAICAGILWSFLV